MAERTIGVLLIQLGTPDAPHPDSLREYLRQFLWDPRIVEEQRFLWWFVLNGIVLPKRSKRSAELYREIWTERGSPLRVISEDLRDKLERAFGGQLNDEKLSFQLAMRYGRPSISDGLSALLERGAERILIFPLFPQYSGTTTGSICDEVFRFFLGRRWVPALRFARPFCEHPAYIRALSDLILSHLEEREIDLNSLIFSFHGIPMSYAERGDPYPEMCRRTFLALKKKLSRNLRCYFHLAYQSRFGREEWLRPYLDDLVVELARSGEKRIGIVAPAFVADCLETLYELEFEVAPLFLEAGGELCERLPSLNADSRWVEALKEILLQELAGWY